MADPTSPLYVPDVGNMPVEKHKSHHRLLKSLKRISSSPSLAKLRSSTHLKHDANASVSCTSLSPASSTGHSPSNSYSSQPSADLSFGTSSPSPLAETHTPTSIRSRLRPWRKQSKRMLFGLAGSAASSTSHFRPISKGSGLGSLNASMVFTPLEAPPDYFSVPIRAPAPVAIVTAEELEETESLDLFSRLPPELWHEVLGHLEPPELVRCSLVSRTWRKACLDGQLWMNLDMAKIHSTISAEAMSRLIQAAGPFLKDLNLRGCLQMQDSANCDVLSRTCQRLESLNLHSTNIERSALRTLVAQNVRLVHLNLTGLLSVTNTVCSVVARSCPALEVFNVSWCLNMDGKGVRRVVEACTRLKDLRVSEINGLNHRDVLMSLFETNRLERLVLAGCSSLGDDAIEMLTEGRGAKRDVLTGRADVPARRWRHIDLSRCHNLTARALQLMAQHVPDLEGLQVGGCTELTDDGLEALLPTIPRLTHLDLEDCVQFTDASMSALAAAPCAPVLKYLCVGYCEKLGDTGLVPVVKACTSLGMLDVDNTRASNMLLAETARMVRQRSTPAPRRIAPATTLQLVAYDCQNVTWTGVREVLYRNTEITFPEDAERPRFPAECIQIKCFYGWQMTVDEHRKRVLRTNYESAKRLEVKWAEYEMANEEASATGAGHRRRRRRAREAEQLRLEEEEDAREGEDSIGGGIGAGGLGRRRRARSGGCTVM